jgi:hypothetical protein
VSVITAAQMLSWGCLAVLALVMAGILRQLRELQAEVASSAHHHGTSDRPKSAMFETKRGRFGWVDDRRSGRNKEHRATPRALRLDTSQRPAKGLPTPVSR